MTRRPVLALLLTLTALTASGCVTVHGERALIPSVRKAEAAKVLAGFARTNNKANETYDAKLMGTIETGPLGAADQAGLTARHTNNPDGNPSYTPIELSDTSFLIPRQRGWPKWFVADTVSSKTHGARWLLVFQRGSAAEPWKASNLGVYTPASALEFARDSEGYVEPVSGSATDLLVAPDKLSTAYTDYLQKGTAGSGVFAAGLLTSKLRSDRAASARTATLATQYADQPTKGGEYPAIALRTKDGGALVFFASHHTARTTSLSAGVAPPTDADTRALMTGTAKTSVTFVRIGEQAAKVPARTDADASVVLVSRIVGLVTAKGE
jgi:hypothetical protein